MNIEIDPVIEEILDKTLSGKEITKKEAYELMSCTGNEFHALIHTADALRQKTVGEKVTFVVNRNINFTSVCEGTCKFCNFREDHGVLLDMDTIVSKAKTPGITEVCIQGGLHPEITPEYYVTMLERIKKVRPDIHIHAFSPAEINHMREKSGLSVKDILIRLKRAGLDSIPGTAAEILDDTIRKEICPEKITTEQWVTIIKTAHRLDIPTTATIMYGHIESPLHRVDHIFLVKNIQKETQKFTEFVPLTFMPANQLGKIYHLQGASGMDDTRLYAVSRIILDHYIPNLQVSWVKLGHKFAQLMLMCGANDIGGTLYEENISKASGSTHGDIMYPEEFVTLIKTLGRRPVQRDTVYNVLKEYS